MLNLYCIITIWINNTPNNEYIYIHIMALDWESVNHPSIIETYCSTFRDRKSYDDNIIYDKKRFQFVYKRI